MNNDGRGFQKEIERCLIQYQRDGLLRCKKVDPPVRVIGFGARRQVIFQVNPWLDYVGAWRERGGRLVTFEAKSTADPRLPFGKEAGVSKDQLEAMHHWGQTGAAVFVLWQVRNIGTFFVLESAFVRARDEGRRSVRPEDGRLIRQGIGFATVHFLEIMREVWPGREDKPSVRSK